MTKKKEVNVAIPNKVDGVWKISDHTQCENCNEDLLFSMKDKYHEFSLSLTNVLKCLVIAEKEGYIPKIPDEWWLKLK
ncbi:hypothetical protein [Ligilactobacillus salivarius]|uniref:hypothetical protein n=1 Tax=Ligilactobacillus salivarius TaxID=1624 RepID=UPI003660342F